MLITDSERKKYKINKSFDGVENDNIEKAKNNFQLP